MKRTTEFSYMEEVENYIGELVKFAERVPRYQPPIELQIEDLRREIERKCYQRKNEVTN